MLILSVFFYNRTTDILRSNFITLSSMHLDQAVESMDARFSEMIRLGSTLSRQNTLRTALEKDPSQTSLVQQGEDLTEMEISLSNVAFDSSVLSVRLFVNPDFSYAGRRVFTWPLSSASALVPGRESLLMKQPLLSVPNTYQNVFAAPSTVFSVTTPIYSSSDYGKAVALICVDISQDTILEILKKADFSDNGRVYLTDASRNVLLCYSNAEEAVIEDTVLPSLPEEGSQRLQKDSLTMISPMILGSYYLVTETPILQYTVLNALFPLQFLGFALFIGLLIYLLAAFYSRFNSRRIMQLSKTFQKLRDGDLNVHCIVDSEDEIGELQLSFNEMVQRMQNMMESQYQLGKRLQRNEFQLLQAQINPHFLYNTLDLAAWAAKNRDAGEVCDIIEKLSRYYRISLSKGQETILLTDELEHISLYVALQNKRFENRIHLQFSNHVQTEQLKILKLILQPIVENSILHGLQGEGKELNITISIFREEASLRIMIADDGSGIPAHKLAHFQLYQELQLSAEALMDHTSDQTGGYGILNVSERIRSFYGPQSSLSFDSAAGRGTTVTISLPYEKCLFRY